MPKARIDNAAVCAEREKARYCRVDIDLGIAVHVEDALIGAGGHGSQVPGAGAVVGVYAVEAAHGVGKTEVADEALLDAVVLEPEDGGVLGMGLDASKNSKRPRRMFLSSPALIAEKSLLEEGGGGFGVVAVGGIVSAAEVRAGPARRRWPTASLGHASHPGLGELACQSQ